MDDSVIIGGYIECGGSHDTPRFASNTGKTFYRLLFIYYNIIFLEWDVFCIWSILGRNSVVTCFIAIFSVVIP